MKKILLLASILISLSFNGISQCIPDGTITKPGIFPDSATNLPHAFVGVPYSTVMQVRVPKDTLITLPIFGPTVVTIDTITLTSMTLSPSPAGGYTSSCNPNAGCYFLTNTNGCVLLQLTSTPNASQIGMVYHITATTRTHAHIKSTGTALPAQIDNITYYYIQVDDNSGISMINGSNFSVTQNNPNPFNKSTFIEFYSPTGGMVSFTVSNMLGKRMSTKSIRMQPGNNKITLSAKEFEPGIYFYTITTDKQSVTKRMMVDYE